MHPFMQAATKRKRFVRASLVLALIACAWSGGKSLAAEEIQGQDSLPADCQLCVDPYERPIGWASVGEGTSGGGGPQAKSVLVRNHAELAKYARDPKIGVIYVCGEIGGPDETDEIQVGSNKTIIGVGRNPTVRIMLDVNGVSNVIIRNLFVRAIYTRRPYQKNPDGLVVKRSHHVWLDHLDIQDSYDGNLDITDRSDYITVSWCKFSYTDTAPQPNHRFSNLIGSGKHDADRGKLNVTLHHNWWAENVDSRMPRARYGQIHVFNIYVSSRGNAYCIRSDENAQVFVEANYFEGVQDPIDNQDQFTGHVRFASSNILKDTKGYAASRGTAFEPRYPYAHSHVLEEAADVPAMVTAGAGPRLP